MFGVKNNVVQNTFMAAQNFIFYIKSKQPICKYITKMLWKLVSCYIHTNIHIHCELSFGKIQQVQVLCNYTG